MLSESGEKFRKVSDQKCIICRLSVPITLLVFSHHVFDVMLTAFLGELGNVFVSAFDLTFKEFLRSTLFLERECTLVDGKGEIRVIMSVTDYEFKA